MKTRQGLQDLRYIAAIPVLIMHLAEALQKRVSDIPAMNFGLGFAGIDVESFFVEGLERPVQRWLAGARKHHALKTISPKRPAAEPAC